MQATVAEGCQTWSYAVRSPVKSRALLVRTGRGLRRRAAEARRSSRPTDAQACPGTMRSLRQVHVFSRRLWLPLGAHAICRPRTLPPADATVLQESPVE